jgi:Uma2 family endonuclease
MAIDTLDIPTAIDVPEWLDADTLYEIVDGEFVEKEAMSVQAIDLGFRICERIHNHCDAFLGRARTEMLIEFPGMPQRRRTDVVYVSYDEWPKDRPMPTGASWSVLPKLCIEVISPTDRFEAVKIKMAEYFTAGVSLVWIVTPAVSLLEVYTSMTASRGYRPGEPIDATAIIPGLHFNIADVL